jgi:hypothetical protein
MWFEVKLIFVEELNQFEQVSSENFGENYKNRRYLEVKFVGCLPLLEGIVEL